jgi:L-ascorbate metabolism protein UlaG (beta-lactamase superfamily)
MTLPDNTIWHLGHSSVAIKISGRLLIFDYARPVTDNQKGDGFHNGRIIPEKIKGESVIVFASHGHEDHFNPDIFKWRQTIPNITYIISYDIKESPDEAIQIKPNRHLDLDGLTVGTYPSTDDGVAFSIFLNHRHIYFSGDNAFWNWDGDLDDDIYIRLALSAIDTSMPMDIAFQVCDPRLEQMGAGGIYIFARVFKPELLVPIHSFGEYAFNKRADQKLREQGFEKKFWCVGGVGETFRLK